MPSSSSTTTTLVTAAPADGAVEVVVVEDSVSPDIDRLSDFAAAWSFAREDAISDGLVERSELLPPSNTDLSLLPVVPRPAADENEPDEEEVLEPEPIEPEPVEPEAPEEEPASPEEAEEPDADEGQVGATGDAGEPTAPETPVAEEPEAPVEDEPEAPAETEPEATESEPEPPQPEELIEDEIGSPSPPAQVDGRVPPPNGGPTAAQWDALRRCESTHNYQAISPSGLYRGAYQFSQQTWDWVAGIHQPHLVGIDPINAEPAWQDIMAYTLFAMRGWDQWPVCGKNLL